MPTFLSANLDTSWFTPADNRQMVPRQRLLEHLHTHQHVKLRALIAPYGSGKSTLLQQYYSLYPEHCAWMSLQEEDASANCFFRHLSASIRRVHPDFIGPVLCHEFGDPEQPTHLFFELFYQALLELEAPLTLIVDDAHQLEPVSWRNRFYELIMESPNIHWIVAGSSRSAMFGDIQFDSNTLVISQEHLYFKPHELKIFLSKNAAHQTFNEMIAQTTRGWPAGVKIAQLCLTRPDSAICEVKLPSRELFTFLVDNLLDQLDNQTQRFLTQTAFLYRFNQEMCQQFVRGINCKHAIDILLETRFLLEITPEHPLCYNFNPLVKQRLLERFALLSEQEREQLVAGACTWLTEHGYRLDGCRTAAFHPHPEIQQQYFQKNLVRWLRTGNLQTLFQRLRSPEASSLANLPQARMAWCWLMAMSGRLLDAGREIEQLLGDRTIEDVLQDPQNATEANCAVLYGTLVLQRGGMDESIIAALHQLSRHPQIYTSLRATLTCLLAQVEMGRFQLQEAKMLLEQSMAISKEKAYEYNFCVTNDVNIRLCYLNNDQNSTMTLAEAMQHRTTEFPNGIGSAILRSSYGFLLYKNQNQENGYRLCLAECGALPWLHIDSQVLVYRTLARHLTQQGKLPLAEALLEFVEGVALATGSKRYYARILLEQFHIAVRTNDQVAAQALADKSNLFEQIEASVAKRRQHDWLSWLLSGIFYYKTCGDLPAAMKLARQLQQLNVESGYPLHFLPLSLLTPWLEYCAGNHTTAYIKLSDILGQASVSGIRPGLFDEIPGIEELLNQALLNDRIADPAQRDALLNLGYGQQAD